MLISGTWFGFQHPNLKEGPNWNPEFQKFTPAQWRALVAEMAGIGMEYLVMMGSACDSQTFYQSKTFKSFPMATPDPMAEVFKAADEFGLKIFVSNDFYADYATNCNVEEMFTNPEIRKRRETAMAEMAEKFGHHKSFYGWYWPNELDIFPYFEDSFIKYVSECRKFADTLLTGKKSLIAPYGTYHLKADDNFCRQLERLDVDYIAYQDEIGVRKANYDWTPWYFERLKAAHDKVGKAKLWADMEVFQFEGPVYTTPLHPAPIERIIKQLEGISPFVERVLIFQYPGIMSKPGTPARVSTPEATRLYTEYAEYRKSFLK